jgi:type VI secretion system protein ImpI
VAQGLILTIRDQTAGTRARRGFVHLPVRVGRNLLNDCRVDEPFVSQFHLVLELHEGELRLRDLGSRNGTWIGDSKAPPNEPVAIPPDGSFRIHSLVFRPLLIDAAVVLADAPGDAPKLPRTLAQTVVLDQPAAAQEVVRKPEAATARLCEQHEQSARRLGTALATEFAGLDAGERLAYLAWLRANHPTALALVELRGAAEGVGVPASALDPDGHTLVKRAVDEFARTYFPDAPDFGHGEESVLFLDRLKAALDVFLKCFVPLRDGYHRFETELDIRRSTGRDPDAVRTAQSPEELGRALLDWHGDSDGAPHQVEEVFADLMIHQVAMLGGVMRGVKSLLRELSPAEVSRALEERRAKGTAGLLWGPLRERALWKIFQVRHSDLAEEEKRTFSLIFGAQFARTYAQFIEENSEPEGLS